MQKITQLIASTLQPQGRAEATAATFTTFFNVVDTAITEAQFKAALLHLSQPKSEDEPPHISARRKTCAEIAELCNVEAATFMPNRAWHLWATHLEGSIVLANETEKPRLSAMFETAKRELKELFEAVNFV